jgi:hypothetical protein
VVENGDVLANSVKISKHQFNKDPFFGCSVVQSIQLGGQLFSYE